MRPIRLTMSAFGSYAGEETVDFSGMENGIFLVTGDTGSGKTTIFDGIVYALYDCTSGGVRDGNMMRSAYADLKTPTYVELCFLCRGEEYRIIRNPDYERESLRRDKNGSPKKTQEKAKVEFYLPDGSLFRGNKKDTNAKIQELLGLDARQFMQVAMIAQGDFLKLLHAKSEEREEIFSRIFDTGIYAKMQEELRRREKEQYTALKEKEQAVSEQISRILVDDEDGRETDAPGSERESSLKTAVESGDLGKVLTVLREILDRNHAATEKAAEALAEKCRAVEKETAVSGILEAFLILQEKIRAQQDWLKDNLPKEKEYKDSEDRAEKETREKEETLREFQKHREQKTREFREREQKLKGNLKELENLKSLWEAAIRAMKAQKEKAAEWERANAFYQEQKNYYEAMYEAFFREQAGILASGLKEGMPCPVCGSVSHPLPARASENAPDQAQVQKAKASAEGAEKSREQAQQSFQEAAGRYQTAFGSLKQEGGRLLGEDFHPNEESWRQKSAVSMTKAKEELQMCQNEYKSFEQQDKERLRSLEEKLQKCSEVLREIRRAREEFIRKGEQLKGEAKACREQEAELMERWTDMGMKESPEEFRNLYNREVLSKLQSEKRLLEEQRQMYAAREMTNRRTYEILKQYKEEYGILKERYTTIRHLSQTACGSLAGTAKLDFESYIQRQYFERVIQYANHRLIQMTSGQFLLKCKDLEQLGNRGKVGLDLDVYSLVTESVRDVKTLSGGESFMAALAMALGLADVIRDKAGAIRLDTLFIDEGFGSLDENSREQAVRVLYELAGENRLIGIVSHVTELKEQIEKQLRVKKTKTGSHVLWKR